MLWSFAIDARREHASREPGHLRRAGEIKRRGEEHIFSLNNWAMNSTEVVRSAFFVISFDMTLLSVAVVGLKSTHGHIGVQLQPLPPS